MGNEKNSRFYSENVRIADLLLEMLEEDFRKYFCPNCIAFDYEPPEEGTPGYMDCPVMLNWKDYGCKRHDEYQEIADHLEAVDKILMKPMEDPE